MRRLANALLAGAVAALVAAAALDTFLRDGGDEATGEPLVATLREAGVRGELVWSDSSCRRHAVRLPGLAKRDFRTVGCGVFTRYDNLGVRDGEVAWFAFAAPGGTTTLLDRRSLRFQVGTHFRVRTVAWLGGTSFAAILSGPRTLVTTWEGPSMRTVAVVGDGYRELRASRSGRFFAALGDGRLLVFDRDGRRLRGARGRAVAWSLAERFVAVAGEGGLDIYPAGGGRSLARLPIDAVDVDWRAPD